MGIEVPLLMEQDYLEKILEVYLKMEHRGPTTQNFIPSNRLNKPVIPCKKVTSGTKMGTEVSLKEFVLQYKPGTLKDAYGTEYLQSLCLDFYKDSPEHVAYLSSITHFTTRFKKHWDLEYSQNPLVTKNIRDPNNRKKRGIACIKTKG